MTSFEHVLCTAFLSHASLGAPESKLMCHVPDTTTDQPAIPMADSDEKKPLVAAGEVDSDDKEWNGCGPALLCDPRRSPHRFIILIFTCFLNFGQTTYHTA